MSLGERKFLDLIAELKTQVQEEVILERAKAIFSEAVAIIEERENKLAFARQQEASHGAERLHNLMEAKMNDPRFGMGETLTGTFTSKSTDSIDMAGASHPIVSGAFTAEEVEPPIVVRNSSKRTYTHHQYVWLCKMHGRLKLTIPQARKHSRLGKEHLLEHLEEEQKTP